MNEYFMKKAIDLATLGSGFVNPNPLSGVVIVKNNTIISEGFYSHYGDKYAEIIALEDTSVVLNDAIMYVTIEPYYDGAHMEKLLSLLQNKGIKKIYFGMLNPNPDKKINLLNELKKIGIEYEVGPLMKECMELNEIYAYYIVHKLPFVFVKWAMTLDGKLATKTGDSKWISSDESLEFVHHLRQRVSAIMVGENTVKQDDPLLTTRLDGVKISNPLRVILSKYGDIPTDAKVLKVDSDTKTLIIASEDIRKDKEEELLNKGILVAKLALVDNHIDFHDIMKLLGSMGIDSLYIEGGSGVLGSAFESGCVHKVYTAIAPKIIGGYHAITPVGGNGIELMRNAIMLKNVSYEIIGPDVVVKGYI